MGGIDGWGIGGPPDYAFSVEKRELHAKIVQLESEIKSLKRRLRNAQKKIKQYKLGECKDWVK
jgi:hypothetical protein